MKPNRNYAELKDSYLFYNIAQKTRAYLQEHPDHKLYRMGIGDVSLPLSPVVIDALHEAVDDQGKKDTFHGYMPETGDPTLRKTIADYYKKKGVGLAEEEVFVSSGASDELGDILDLFDRDNTALVMEPAYPAYVDASVIAGREVIHLPAGKENGFLPQPREDLEAARPQGKKIKLLCRGRMVDGQPVGTVEPTLVEEGSLPAIMDATSSYVTVTTDLMGGVTVIEEPFEPEIDHTAYGVLSDLLRILRETAGARVE